MSGNRKWSFIREIKLHSSVFYDSNCTLYVFYGKSPFNKLMTVAGFWILMLRSCSELGIFKNADSNNNISQAWWLHFETHTLVLSFHWMKIYLLRRKGSFFHFLVLVPTHAWLIYCHTVNQCRYRHVPMPVNQLNWAFFFLTENSRTKGDNKKVGKKREAKQLW